MEWFVAGVMALFMFAITFAPRVYDISLLHNRLALWASGLGLALAFCMPNPWLAVLLAAGSVNLMLRPQPSQPLKDSHYWMLALAGGYLAVQGQLGHDSVPLFLWACVAMGFALTVYSYWDVNAGQGNPMHVQALAAIAVASLIGLALSMPWLWLLLPVLAWPIWATQRGDARVTLGPLYLLAILAGVAFLFLGWPVLLVTGIAGLAVFLWAWPQSPLWSGRKEWWTAGLTFWWTKAAWWQRLLGFGADAWIVFSQTYLGEIQKFSKEEVHDGYSYVVMPHAHNDYVQVLFDRGLIGLGCVLGYLSTSLYALAGLGGEAWGLFLVGMTLCAVAFGNFPWTGCVIAYLPDQKRLAGYGCPALNYISWMLIVLIEVARRGA